MKIYDKLQVHVISDVSYGLANVAATIAILLNLEVPNVWERSIIQKAANMLMQMEKT